MFISLCAILVSLELAAAIPLNDTRIMPDGEPGQCGCNKDIQQLYSELREAQSRIMALETSPSVNDGADLSVNMDTRAIFTDVIGFTVTLLTPVSDLPLGSTVLFDNVHYNAGSAYDPSTGVFTCPRSGMYLFSIYVSATTATEANIEIKINGRDYIAAVSEPILAQQDTTGGNTLVQHIQQGDSVWVETIGVNNQHLYKHYTSFSGVLIQSTTVA
ncbi:positive regulation of adiponectin secretion [Mactra antiquata]